MKVSLQWLKDYVAIDLPVDKLAHRLTMAGHEVKQQESLGGDTVFEIEITPNRPDCLNMLGLARELSAILNRPLRLPKVRKFKIPTSACPVTIEDPKACVRYVGAIIENVSVRPAPAEVKKKIQAIGLRPINNVVDLTNFCLMESGQPLHAFDYDKLIGGRIIVRRARAGEKIITLDGVERMLNPSILVIADAERPVAIAGIMGGKDAEVTENTQRILLESAWFDPILIRRAGRSLGLSSDSSYRFERGVDLENVDRGAQRAISLILDISGGQLKAYKDVFPKRKKGAARKIKITQDEIKKLLGAESFPAGKTKTILQKLGFRVSMKGKSLQLIPPSFRGDIKEGVDIIEEIARIIGYDNVPASLPLIRVQNIPSDGNYVFKKGLRQILSALRLNEVISYPLMGKSFLEKSFVDNLSRISIKNPLTLDQQFMRPTLLPSLLAILRGNLNQGQRDVCIFELGKNYFPKRPNCDWNENEFLGVLLAGELHRNWREQKRCPVDFYDIKGVVAQVIGAVSNKQPDYQQTGMEWPYFVKGAAATIGIKTKETYSIGALGKINKEVLKNWDIKEENVYFAEIELESLFNYQKNLGHKKYRPITPYPVITRDVSLAVSKGETFQQVVDLAHETGGKLLVDIIFLEQYLGEKIPSDQKGLVFSVVYQAADRTLTDEEIAPLHDQICKAFVEKLGAVIR